MQHMIKCNKYTVLLLGVLCFFFSKELCAQDDLLGLLGDEHPPKEFVKYAFKSTRVITGHSIEQVAGGVLDFRILHRFGRLNGGAYEAYGFDQATTRLGLDYGLTDRWMIGLGRSNYKKELDAFMKYKLLWQSTGEGSLPLSILLVTGVTKDGLEWSDPDRNNYYTSRLAFFNQIIFGRKFSEAFSLQIMPSMVHRNLVPTKEDSHDIYSVGVASRLKLSKRIALTAEYFYNLPDQLDPDKTNPLSLGFDIETGGHVFQLHFTNALGLNERALITETSGHWGDGDVHFGFNISRVFTLSKPKTFRK